MPQVFIPPNMRALVGQEIVSLEGGTVRSVIEELERQFPGVRERLCEADRLKAGVSASINGSIATRGLSHVIGPDDELHFLPAIGGG
jgi:molybdopterin synthase sulfur carrier subunit